MQKTDSLEITYPAVSGLSGAQLNLGSINNSTINLNQLTPQVISQYTAAQLSG